MKLLRIQLLQCCCEFESKLRRIEKLAACNENIRPVTWLTRVVAGRGREGHRNKAHPWNLPYIQIRREFASINPRRTEKFERSVGPASNGNVCAFDQRNAGIKCRLIQAA